MTRTRFNAVRGSGARALVALAAAASLMAASSPAAGAADAPPEPITQGTLDWGIKESFRSYITGGIARGAITVGGGATRNADETFRFPIGGGAFDPVTGATSVATAGDVHFTGHRGELDMRVADVRVELTEEGALLRADVESLPLGSTTPVAYDDVALATLDIAAVDPVTVDGVTTWSAIPTTLTSAGAPAFGGFYSAGVALDPVTFSYTGNGGKPTIEQFTAPGTPFYARTQVQSDGRSAVHLDEQLGLLLKLDSVAVVAVDADTLAPVGAPFTIPNADALNRLASGYDPAARRLYVAWQGGTISAFDWTGSGFTRSELPGTHGTRTLAVADGRLYVVATGGSGARVTVISGAPGAWDVREALDVDTGGNPITKLVGLPGGRLVGAVDGRLNLTPPISAVPSQAIVLHDTGTTLEKTAIAGTTPPPLPTAGRITRGYVELVEGPAGRLLLGEFTNDLSLKRLQWLRYDATGVAVDGDPIGVGYFNAFAVAPDDGRIYLSYSSTSEDLAQSRVDVLGSDGTPFSSIPGLKTNVLVPGSGGTLWSLLNQTPVPTVKLQLAGTSPRIVSNPQDQAVELADAAATATATFTAAADATPGAEVRWQRRAIGATRWSDVEGATAPTLEVPATAAANGTRYRAVFENGGGRIATTAATLAVTVAPTRPVEPDPDKPGTPSTPETPGTPAHQGTPPAPTTPVVPPTTQQPPRSRQPSPALRPAAIARLDGLRRIGRDGVARVATLRCPAGRRGACRVAAPRRVQVRIGRSRYAVRVLAPSRVRAGRAGALRLRLSPAARRQLAGRRVQVRVRVSLVRGQERVTRQVTVRLGA